jgi:acyl-CoA synthetase (AMP-forming)/AMP-acid ligase II
MGDRRLPGKSQRLSGSEELNSATVAVMPPSSSSGVYRALGDADEAISRAEEVLRARFYPLEELERAWQTKDFLPDARLTIPELIAWRAVQSPQQTALHNVDFVGDVPHATALSYLELAQKVQRAACILAARGVRARERVVLAVARPEAFLAFLFAAQCLGAIPIPVGAPGAHATAAFNERLRQVVRDTRPRAVVVDEGAQRVDTSLHSALQIVDSAELAGALARPVNGFSWSRKQDEIALLSSTSGSAGHAKSVVVLHRNLIANCRALVEAAELGSEDRLYSWLPASSPLGIIAGLLLGIYVGLPTYAALPESFTRKPEAWLTAITRYRITFSAAPSWAYDCLLEKVAEGGGYASDLDSWRVAFTGNERVEHAAVQAFSSRLRARGFAAGSFRPGYGLTESTLGATFHAQQSGARIDHVNRKVLAERGLALQVAPDSPYAAAYVSVGKALPGHDVRIFEPGSERELPERRVGEIVVSGPSVTPYYFHELLLGEMPREVLRTADLGYMADGELFVIDRQKDILLVAGAMYSPSDVERVAGSVRGVQKGAVVAFSARIDGGKDELLIAAAPDPACAADRDTLVSEIRDAIINHFGVIPGDVLLVRAVDIARAPDGKIQRNVCRALYEVGALGAGQVSG